jgi:sugar lactone lactonase YvrE
MNYKAEIALKYNAILGESPVWDVRRQALFWIDSVGNKVFVFNPGTGENKIYNVGQNIGTLILTNVEHLALLGLVDGLYELNLYTGALTKKTDPEPDLPGNRLNDGKADALGRIWIGSMCTADNGVEGYDTDYNCNLHRINRDFSCHLMDPKVRLSNGMAWNSDNTQFYYVDSPTRNVYVYDFNLEAGTIENRRICITIPDEFGVCDGMDIDVDGNLWIAHWTGWCVGKWSPQTGELLGKVEIPVSRVASCAFGGKNFDELYVVTASINVNTDERRQPEAGSVFVAKNLGTRGRPFNYFIY